MPQVDPSDAAKMLTATFTTAVAIRAKALYMSVSLIEY
jgi:hypothetical protein